MEFVIEENEFTELEFNNYIKIITELSEIELHRDTNNELLNDILLSSIIKKYEPDFIKTKKIKQLQMKTGKIWQIAIGNYIDFHDLGIGHETGLDILSENRKISMELKNKYNTDNASSRKSNFNKLAAFKFNNPEYECIYGLINSKKPEGEIKTHIHNGVTIVEYSGMKLLNYVFGKKTYTIINTIRHIIDKYYSEQGEL
jgi:hypothetical protein